MAEFPFTFNQESCKICSGHCCRWGGYVWVTDGDLQAMAEVMKLPLEVFVKEYVKASYGRLSLQDRLRDGEYHCSLFDPFNNICLVYPVRPKQCRTFPFWDQFRSNYQKLLEFCPGISEKES
jgi:Fe-S-cluster containining protein